MSLSHLMNSLSGITSKLKHINKDEDTIKKAKIENCIGSVKVPVGIAGPLSVKGTDGTDGIFHAPLATSEATLVASCSRGCKVLNAGGGVQFKVLRETMTRGPVFWFSSPGDAISFYDMVPNLFSEFRDAAQSTSKHAKLVRIEPQLIGSTVHVIFEYYCGNAVGQNMATFATEKACDTFAASDNARVVNLQKITIEGQTSAEKSLSWRNILHSRGVAVMAWGTVTPKACQKVLGISTWDLYQLIQNSKEAATRSGQLGYNINQVNVIAAMFVACGQDAGSIAESAWSHLATEFNDETKELSVSTYLPSLPVGTVGGGTTLDTQREALEILGCTGPGSKPRLAGLIACFSLALDISTVAAVTNNTFAASHYKFARDTPGRETQSKL
ncbi:unnamed protein product [Penicillium manginii]